MRERFYIQCDQPHMPKKTAQNVEAPEENRIALVAKECEGARLACGTRAKPTPQLAESFAKLMELGMPMSHACNLLRVSETSVQKWKTLFPEWQEAIDRGRALFVQEHLSGINEVAKKTWQARAWLLERCQPKYFSRAQEIAIGHTMSQALGAEVLSRLADEEPDKTITLPSEQNSIGETILTGKADEVSERSILLSKDSPDRQNSEISDSADLMPPTTPPPPATTTVSPPSKKISYKKKPLTSTESQP